jgi:hypothetical protein
VNETKKLFYGTLKKKEMYATACSKCTVPKIKIIAQKVQYFSFSAKQ